MHGHQILATNALDVLDNLWRAAELKQQIVLAKILDLSDSLFAFDKLRLGNGHVPHDCHDGHSYLLGTNLLKTSLELVKLVFGHQLADDKESVLLVLVTQLGADLAFVAIDRVLISSIGRSRSVQAATGAETAPQLWQASAKGRGNRGQHSSHFQIFKLELAK